MLPKLEKMVTEIIYTLFQKNVCITDNLQYFNIKWFKNFKKNESDFNAPISN